MRHFAFLFAALLGHFSLLAQSPLDYQLRLEPVWARVADALGEPGSVESAEFSPDGKYIVSGTKYDNSVIMWRTSDGQERWRQYTAEEVERVGWSADGELVAAASEDYLVTIYFATSGETKRIIELSNAIDGLTWSHEGRLLAVGEEKTQNEDGPSGGFVRIYDLDTGEEVRSMDFGATVNELFFTQDDQYLLAVGHGDVKVYRASDGELMQSLGPDYYVTFTTGVFSPDGKYVLAAGSNQQARGSLFLWDWQEGKLLKRFNHTGKKVESVSWHPNGDYIAHAGHDPYIYLYRVADIMNYSNDHIPMANRIWAGDHAEYIDFNADGSFLVSAHQNGLIKLWVWMGENAALNAERHRWIRTQQTDAKN
jgi:WD40 repeat protein